MESQIDPETALALLEWQLEMGASEAICDTPVDRFALDAAAPKPASSPAAASQPVPAVEPVDPVAEARSMAQSAQDIDGLRAALSAYDHCELKKGARNLVFSDGRPQARVMVIGDAPGREEDREGRPFMGREGQLLDLMFEAIGLGRAEGEPLYLTTVLPWRPPQNRDPRPEEIAMMLPFVQRHVELIAPEVVILMGNISCLAAMGRKGVVRLRGAWTTAFGRDAMPMCDPAYLLRNPTSKREAWQDLLMVQARLRKGAR
ncbi:uracil-DNA glycosylase [Poseidonocella pacifica]|nr:uracil-DNA glycosylase [Poseidonocella pacifica]